MRTPVHYCPECGSAAKIQKTDRVDPKLTRQYCACSNIFCGHTFVLQVEFLRSINPGIKKISPSTVDQLCLL